MPKKNYSIHQPSVAVFDLLRPLFGEYNSCVSSAFYAERTRNKKNRRPDLSGSIESGVSFPSVNPSTSGLGRIAVLVASLSDHFTNSVIAGIELAGGKAGYEIAILNILGKQPLMNGLDQFDGFIACCSGEAAVDTGFFEELGKPVVLVGNIENAGGYHCVKANYYQGAGFAVDYLIDQGCQKIWMISPASGMSAARLDQYLGYRDTLKSAGKEWREPLTVKEASIETGMEMAVKMIENGELPDGVFITNDWIAAGFVKYLKKAPAGVTKKIAVVGFGNDSLCEMVEPTLCSIDFREELSGSEALHTLHEQIQTQQILRTNNLTLVEPALVIRN